MNDFVTLLLERKNGIARLILNRPEKHNALNAQMIRELRQAVEMLSGDEAVRVVILAASGKSFCAGGDLNWMREQVDKDRAGKIAESSQLALMLKDLDELPKPLIGRIHGPAYGGGVGMVSVCDIAIGSENAKFALTETRLGLIPATIGPYVVRRLGEGAARQVFMNGQAFDANRAVKLGLLAEAVRESDLDEAVGRQAGAFLACAPGAVARAKALCQALARENREDTLEYTANCLADAWESEEASQGIAAFFDREQPPWKQ